MKQIIYNFKDLVGKTITRVDVDVYDKTLIIQCKDNSYAFLEIDGSNEYEGIILGDLSWSNLYGWEKALEIGIITTQEFEDYKEKQKQKLAISEETAKARRRAEYEKLKLEFEK